MNNKYGNNNKDFIFNKFKIDFYQIGKDVKELKDYEHNLVKQYKFFIDYLDVCIKGKLIKINFF